MVISPAPPNSDSLQRDSVHIVQYEKSFVAVISNIFLLYLCVADVDECASDSHQCNPTQICINTEGGYTCSCTEGYWLLEGQCLGKILNCYSI